MSIRPTFIRTRLTLWYLAIFSIVIVFYVCVACCIQYWQLNDQLYHAEVQDMETVEGLLYFDAQGHLQLNEDYHSHSWSRLLLDRFMEVRDLRGNVLFRNEKLNGQSLGGAPLPLEAAVSHFAQRFRLPDGTHVLAVSHYHPVEGRRVLIRIAYSTEHLRVRALEMLAILLLVLPLALVAAGFAGYRIAGKALIPISAMADLTDQITASELSRRVPIENPRDEFGRMACVLNGLLERLEESFHKLRRFTSDASHELRTPLASIRSVGEVGLQQRHAPEEYKDIIGSMLEEVSRLSSMIDTLLTISQADSGAIRLNRTVFPIKELVDESVALVGVLADEKRQKVLVDGENQLLVSADRAFLRMAVINLLDNAVKYSPAETDIHIRLAPWNGTDPQSRRQVDVCIRDQGPGISPAEASRVFDRFYRVDESRTRETGGAGLGLAIAKWSIEAHGGKILLDSAPGQGAAFHIRLPLA